MTEKFSRRALLLGGMGVAGLAVGAGATEAIDRSTTSAPAPEQIPVTEDLMTDHGMLKRILLVYRECARRLGSDQDLDPAPLFHAAQMVHDYIEGFHEGVEEGYVFPRLLRAHTLTDTVETLLTQHDRGRKLTIRIIDASTLMKMGGGSAAPGFATAQSRTALATTLTQFIDMYEPHEAREDTEVFPALRRVTSPGEFASISRAVADDERRRFGSDPLSAFLGEIAGIETQLGIHDLAKFTPPDPGPLP